MGARMKTLGILLSCTAGASSLTDGVSASCRPTARAGTTETRPLLPARPARAQENSPEVLSAG